MTILTSTIGQLTLVTSAAAADLIEIEVAASGLSRKITKANLIGATLTGGGSIVTGGFTLTIPKTGTVPVGTGTDGRVAQWSGDANTLAAATLAKTGAGVLTLAAAGAYTLTVPATGTAVLLDAVQTLTSKTLTTPTIGSFTNAQHAHTGATSGGQLTTAALSNLSTLVQTTGTQSIAGNKTFTNDVTVNGVLTAENLSLFLGGYAINLFDSAAPGANTKIQVAISRATSTTNVPGGQFDVRMTGRVGTTVKGGVTTISWNGRNAGTIQYVAMNTAGSMAVAVVTQNDTQLTLTFDLAPGGNWNEFAGSVLLLTPASSSWIITCTQVA